jgi:hypothetical protein
MGFLIIKKNLIIDFVCRFHIYSVIAIISITSDKRRHSFVFSITLIFRFLQNYTQFNNIGGVTKRNQVSSSDFYFFI